MNKVICPVPLNQRPLNEFNVIRNSWIISWPFLERSIFYRNLTFSWLFITPIIMTISYGSDYLKNNITELLFISFTASLVSPLLLLIRQWLSWIYIYERLNSENIEYEESGWYDGQTWEKPVDWRSKDLLIAQHQIKPILNHLAVIIKLLISLIIFLILLILLVMN
tara:strand:- start:162 stop:659 length:498 start_codon:yes stop_codon:yes gene_type:complete